MTTTFTPLAILALLTLGACSDPEPASVAPAAPEANAEPEAPAANNDDDNTAAKSAHNAEQLPGTDEYRTQAKALVEAINGDTDPEALIDQANALTKTGVAMLESLVEKHPVCGDYLRAIALVAPTLHDLPLEEIESGYHKDEKLPAMPDPACYHGKDLVVHPATVAALAKKGITDADGRAAAVAEITEVLSHLDVVTTAE